MTLKEAINIRTSRRSYTSQELPQDAVLSLKNIMDEANSAGAGLNFCLVTHAAGAFSSILKTYGLFSGVHSYIIAAGPENDARAQQLLGYYGELLVLTATSMGLASCWVGATYDKGHVDAALAPGQKIYCLITIGYAKDKYSMGEKLAHSVTHHQTHNVQQIMGDHSRTPQWFMDGIHAVLKAPSARNKLPVHFSLEHGCVSAWADPNGGYENIDLGIAKLHFELGADYIFYDLREKEYRSKKE